MTLNLVQVHRLDMAGAAPWTAQSESDRTPVVPCRYVNVAGTEFVCDRECREAVKLIDVAAAGMAVLVVVGLHFLFWATAHN